MLHDRQYYENEILILKQKLQTHHSCFKQKVKGDNWTAHKYIIFKAEQDMIQSIKQQEKFIGHKNDNENKNITKRLNFETEKLWNGNRNDDGNKNIKKRLNFQTENGNINF
jgi:hypothetical protein